MDLIRKRPPSDARELRLCEPENWQRDLNIYGNHLFPSQSIGGGNLPLFGFADRTMHAS